MQPPRKMGRRKGTAPWPARAVAMQAISRWIAMKVMVAEHNLGGDAVSTGEQCGSFRATLAIPGNFRIWVGP